MARVTTGSLEPARRVAGVLCSSLQRNRRTALTRRLGVLVLRDRRGRVIESIAKNPERGCSARSRALLSVIDTSRQGEPDERSATIEVINELGDVIAAENSARIRSDMPRCWSPGADSVTGWGRLRAVTASAGISPTGWLATARPSWTCLRRWLAYAHRQKRT